MPWRLIGSVQRYPGLGRHHCCGWARHVERIRPESSLIAGTPARPSTPSWGRHGWLTALIARHRSPVTDDLLVYLLRSSFADGQTRIMIDGTLYAVLGAGISSSMQDFRPAGQRRGNLQPNLAVSVAAFAAGLPSMPRRPAGLYPYGVIQYSVSGAMSTSAPYRYWTS